jgi:ABC-2 type transport system ATP-binding protein
MQRLLQIGVEKGWGISEITLEKSSLDEVFAQLSGKRKTKA